MLIKDSKNDIIKEIGISAEFSFEAIKPYIDNEGTDFVKQVLGTTLYNALNTALTDAGDLEGLEEKYKVLLPLVQRPLVYMAFLKYLPMGDVQITDGGISVKTSQTTAPASTRRVQNLKDAMTEIAWNSFEKLLKFLYANADVYDWYDSRPQKAYIAGFINYSSQINDLANVKISAETFSRMKSSVRFIEINQIKSLILTTLFDKIKEQVAENLFEDEEEYEWETGSSGSGSGGDENLVNHKILLDLVRPAIANLALAHALESHRIDIQAAGITEGYESERTENVKASAVVRNEVLRQAINRFREDGDMYLKLAKDYLIDHLEDFPLYEEDPDRDTEETVDDTVYENDEDNKNWGAF